MDKDVTPGAPPARTTDVAPQTGPARLEVIDDEDPGTEDADRLARQVHRTFLTDVADEALHGARDAAREIAAAIEALPPAANGTRTLMDPKLLAEISSAASLARIADALELAVDHLATLSDAAALFVSDEPPVADGGTR